MESLLERGEKLDDLVAKSEHLGNQSKAFYKTVSLNDWPYWHYAKFQDCALNLLSRANYLHICLCLTFRHGNRTLAVKSCDVAASSFLDMPLYLCLSAFPTTPIIHLPPALNQDSSGAVKSKMGHREESKKGWPVWNATSVDCDWWGLKEWWGLVRGEK